MNSIILTRLASIGRGFMNCWRHSGLYALLMRIYSFISSSWSDSFIMTKLRASGGRTDASVSERAASLPFWLLDKVKEKLGGFLGRCVERSFICALSRAYLQNFMALNTRFFGLMLVTASLSFCAARVGISKIALAAGAVGAVMLIFNFNITSFLTPSKAVNIIKNAVGFNNVSFDFYGEAETRGRSRLFTAVAAGLVTGAAMSANTLMGAAIPFALFGILLVMYAPITGVFAAVFLAPFVPTMVLAMMCIWTGLSLVIKSVTDADFKWRFDGVGFVIVLFLGVLFISSLMSFAKLQSLKVWAMYFVFVYFYFVIINTVKTKEQLYGLFKLLVISGALVALYGIAQYVFGWNTTNAWIDEEMFEDSVMRVYSTLGNPNVLGEYLLLVLPVAAVYMLKFKWKSLAKYAYGAMFLCLALCLVLTQSRGCWIGFMLSAVIFVTFYEGRLWGLVPLVLLILPFVIPQTIVERLLSVGNMEDTSTSYRVFIWLGTLGMMKYYWAGGIGMGESAFARVYPFFSYNAIIAPHSHNTFLQLLVEAGICGLAVFLIMQVVFIKNMVTVYRQNDKKSEDSILALALGCGVIGFLAQSMFDYTFYNYRVMAVFFMVMALGMSLRHITKKGGEADA